jgi:hypothetical protein
MATVMRRPPQIALLPGAYTPELSEGQRHFVAFPVEPGPQACLIEVQRGRKLEVVDALTVVPSGIGNTAGRTKDHLYSCWLGVIVRYYRAEVTKARKEWEFGPLAKADVGKPPFVPERHGRLLRNAREFLAECLGLENSQLTGIRSQTLANFKQSIVEADLWYARHIQFGKARKACEEQWRILSCWEAWSRDRRKKDGGWQARMSWDDCLADYSKCYPTRPAHTKQRGRTKRVSLKLPAFKKRCAYLGLLDPSRLDQDVRDRTFRQFAH